jgi:hypothetical protein
MRIASSNSYHFLNMRTFSNLALAATFGVGATLLAAAPSQAQVCTGDGTATASFSLAFYAANPGLTCTVGDKTYSDFTITGFNSLDPAQNVVNISESGVGGLQHTIGMMNTSGWTSAVNTFNYTVTVTTPGAFLHQWAATAGGSIIGSDWETTVAATNSSPSPIGPIDGAFSTAGAPSTFNGMPLSSDFTNTFDVTTQFTSFDNSLTQKVPGPLPILGAGAVFGFSRKLRNRIKTSV